MLLIMARRCPWGMSRVMPCHAVRTHSRIVLFRLLQVLLLTDASAEYLEWTQLGRPFRFRLYSRNTELVFQAAYNVGGHTISIDTLQSSILGCQSPRPGQAPGFESDDIS
ncbi:hypothetical protein V6N13_149664 [Hibiscus sabdariffa]